MSVQPSFKKTMIPLIVGNSLEWYDFAIYGYFAPVFAKLFFHADNETSALLGAFAIFAVGFFFRPLGGIIFGHLGDRYGRKKTLVATIILVAGGTTLIGLLPTYESVGIYAVFMLVFCRILQGVGVGGELPGVMTYLSEISSEKTRGFYSSFAQFGTGAGALLALLVTTGLNYLLSSEDIYSWGWRIPFLFGILSGVIAIYLRLTIPESALFVKKQQEGKTHRLPLIVALKTEPLSIMRTIGLTWGGSAMYYTFFVYLTTFLTIYVSLPTQEASAIIASWLVVYLCTLPCAGFLSDRIGRKPLIYFGTGIIALLGYPFFRLFLSPEAAFEQAYISKVTAIFLSGAFLIACFALFVGAFVPAMAEFFKTTSRYSGMAFGYNVGQIFGGGMAPFIATYLIQITNDSISPAYYLIFCSLLCVLSTLGMKETSRTSLQDDSEQ